VSWKPVAREIAGRLNRPIATRRLARYLAANPPPYRLQIGSGLVQRPGWLNTDIGHRARYWLDMGEPFPFPDGSVTRLFSEHVVEHVPPQVVVRFLREAYRVLASDGILRILTPDAEAHARVYLERTPQVTALLQRNAALGYWSRYPVDILNLTFHENGHLYIWDEGSLTDVLRGAGFSHIQRRRVGESDDPEMAAMDGHFAPNDPAIDFTLVMEARR
jgi:SAM-dependent methyltransferase